VQQKAAEAIKALQNLCDQVWQSCKQEWEIKRPQIDFSNHPQAEELYQCILRCDSKLLCSYLARHSNGLSTRYGIDTVEHALGYFGKKKAVAFLRQQKLLNGYQRVAEGLALAGRIGQADKLRTKYGLNASPIAARAAQAGMVKYALRLKKVTAVDDALLGFHAAYGGNESFCRYLLEQGIASAECVSAGAAAGGWYQFSKNIMDGYAVDPLAIAKSAASAGRVEFCDWLVHKYSLPTEKILAKFIQHGFMHCIELEWLVSARSKIRCCYHAALGGHHGHALQWMGVEEESLQSITEASAQSGHISFVSHLLKTYNVDPQWAVFGAASAGELQQAKRWIAEFSLNNSGLIRGAVLAAENDFILKNIKNKEETTLAAMSAVEYKNESLINSIVLSRHYRYDQEAVAVLCAKHGNLAVLDAIYASGEIKVMPVLQAAIKSGHMDYVEKMRVQNHSEVDHYALATAALATTHADDYVEYLRNEMDLNICFLVQQATLHGRYQLAESWFSLCEMSGVEQAQACLNYMLLGAVQAKSIDYAKQYIARGASAHIAAHAAASIGDIDFIEFLRKSYTVAPIRIILGACAGAQHAYLGMLRAQHATMLSQ